MVRGDPTFPSPHAKPSVVLNLTAATGGRHRV